MNTEWDGFCGHNKISLQNLYSLCPTPSTDPPEHTIFPPKINISSVVVLRKLVCSTSQQPAGLGNRVGELNNIGASNRCRRWKIYNLFSSPCKYPGTTIQWIAASTEIPCWWSVGKVWLQNTSPDPIFTTLFLKGLLLLVHFFQCPTLHQPFQPQLLLCCTAPTSGLFSATF